MRFALLSLVLLICAASVAAQQSAPSPANAIFILGEGQGVGALSVPPAGVGSARPEGLTPNLERLAREGVRFSGFYASCPRCTPSRASFFTGVSPAKLHMTFGNDGNDEREKNTGDVRHLIQPEPLREIPSDQTTIGDILGNAGWRTAHFGKWHVGRLDPARHGYAENDGPNTNMGPGRNRKPNPAEADLITDRGIAFMRDAVKAKKPFYLQLAHYGGGSEDEATAEAHARVKRLMPNARAKEAYQAAVLVDVDRTVGRLLDALDELGVAGNTYVFFSTDHGAPAGGEGGGRRGAGANAPYSGGKGSVREGGLRIPMIVRGPGIPKNEVATVRAVGYDLAPTVADLLGVKTKDGTFEGKSLAPALLSERRGVVRRPEEFFVIHFPHYDLQNGGPASAIYEGSWKLIHQYETDTNRLFDLDADPYEENDRAAAEPERTKKLAQHLFDYLRNVKAQMPVPIDGAAPEKKKEEQGTDQRPRKRNAEDTDGRRQGRVEETPRGGGPSGPFRTDYPAHAYDVIVGAPERTSVPVTVMAFADAEACISYGGAGGAAKKTPVRALHREAPAVFVLDGLAPGAAFEYRVLFRPAGAAEFEAGEPKRVQMPRRTGEGFRFVIQADSHLDVNTDTAVLARSLDDLATERPDFLIDLGDTFMTDKHSSFQDAYPLYIAQRWWFSRIADRAPLYLLLGNHDGEYGYGALGEDGIAGWSYMRRTTFFPPPVPKRDGLYTGRTTLENGRGGNWFSFRWGDALIVALDPFWPTTVRARGGRASGDGAGSTTDDNWAKTLGREQYDWLARTLSSSDAPWKLVFIHHLVGGFGKDARGGAAAAPFFEWGGANADGSYGFAEHRPGWPKPIHDLLVETGVRAVFHGHDHLFVREERDGIIYRCVPQPGNGHPSVRSAEEYGYGAGLVREGSGHLVVDVSADALTLRYRRSAPRPDAKAHEEMLRR